MIKISELNTISSGGLLANTTSVIPISTGNAAFTTFKTTVSSIGEYILSNAGPITTTSLTVGNIIAGNVNTSGNITASTYFGTAANLTSNLTVRGAGTIGGNVFVRGLVVGNVSTVAANAWVFASDFNANSSMGFGDFGRATLANTGSIEFSRWSGGWGQQIRAETLGNLVLYNAVQGISFNIEGISATKIHIRKTTGNLEINSNLLLNAGTFSVGNIAGTRSRLDPGTNNTKLRVRPSMDLNGSGSVSASDVLNWVQVLTGASSVNSFVNSPYVLQHVDKPATGIMVTNNSYLAESLDSTSSAQGQLYLTTGSTTGTIASYLRIGQDDGLPGDIYMKATSVNIAGGTTVSQQSYFTSTVDNFSGGTGFGLTQGVNFSGAIGVRANAYIGGNTWVRGLVVGNVGAASNGKISTQTLSVVSSTDTGGLYSSRSIQSHYPIIAPEKIKNKGDGSFSRDSQYSAGSYPRTIEIHPSGRFIYWTDYSTAQVKENTFNQYTGRLTNVNLTVSAGANTYRIKLDPTGRFAYTTNYGPSTVSQFSINQTTGELTSITTAIATGNGPTSIAIDPTGRFVYVTNGTDDTVSQFSINQSTGALTSIATAIAAGQDPSSVIIDPAGRFAYVANTTDSTISYYSINQTTGQLTSIDYIACSGQPRIIAIDPTGKYLYALTIDNYIRYYTINPVTGVLTAVSSLSAGGNAPIEIAFDPNGWYMYVSNLNSDTVTYYRINQSNGELTQVSSVATNAGPEGLVVDPTGRFLYVVASTAGVIDFYRINDFAVGGMSSGNITVTGNVVAGNIILTNTGTSKGNVVMPFGTASIGNVISSNVSSTIVSSINLFVGEALDDGISAMNTVADETDLSMCFVNTNGGPLSATLGASSGTKNGFFKIFYMIEDGGDCTLTVSRAGWKGGSSGTITFGDVGDGCTLVYMGGPAPGFGAWYAVGSNGVAFA